MIQPSAPFSTLTTEALVTLAYVLDEIVDGGLSPLSDPDTYEELVDTDVLAVAQAEIGHEDLSELLNELTFELQKRAPQIGASLAAWHAWNHRSLSWGAALLDGADAAVEEAAAA